MNSIAAKPACAIPLDRRRAKGKAVLCTKGVELKQMRNILGPMSRIKIGPLKYHQCQPVNAEIYPNKFPANKKRFSEESPNKPTDPLMKDTSSDLLNNRGNYVGSEDQSASSVRTGVVKKVDPIFSIGLQLMRAVSAWYSVLHKDAIPSLKWYISLVSLSWPFSSNVNGVLLS
ncbi:uncharacterized protein LOC104440679 isoform X1 [Eucalyptus grandis]|uniref:uncharacterized protein LOC104440679 isoform X1 n=2 Tax=Eucalyptus grandis TaxID=71139 RepID=UPI00192EA598|nr:uncharacterized protein LOC104440679 isoform X1 [Eucalyptus grandis]